MQAWRRYLLVLCWVSSGSAAVAACGSDDAKRSHAAVAGESAGGQGGQTDANGGGGQATTAGVPAASGNEAGGAASGENDLGFLNEFCDRFAQTECGAREVCYGPTPDCLSNTVQYCHMYGRAELLPAIAAGLIEYDPSKAEECFTAPVEGFCGTNNLWYSAACRDAFKGTVTGNDPCYPLYFLGNELDTCDGGKCNAMPGSKDCGSGRCQPYIADGDPCRDDQNKPILPGCRPGSLCNETSKLCMAGLKRHATCTNEGGQCNNELPLLTCVPRADGKAGFECDLRRPAGEICGITDGGQFSAACESFVCRDNKCVDKDLAGDLYCFSGVCPAGKVCLHLPENPLCQDPIAQGDACQMSDHGCDVGLNCVSDQNPDAPLDGTCQPIAEEGESCLGVECAAALRCVGQDAPTCQPIVERGDDCVPEASTCAVGLDCLEGSGKCGDRLLFGEPCTVDGDCEGGLFCSDDTGTCRPWKHNGEECTRNQECVYGNGCTKGVCDSICAP